MPNIKTAISIVQTLFQEIEATVNELEISRSRFLRWQRKSLFSVKRIVNC